MYLRWMEPNLRWILLFILNLYILTSMLRIIDIRNRDQLLPLLCCLDLVHFNLKCFVLYIHIQCTRWLSLLPPACWCQGRRAGAAVQGHNANQVTRPLGFLDDIYQAVLKIRSLYTWEKQAGNLSIKDPVGFKNSSHINRVSSINNFPLIY